MVVGIASALLAAGLAAALIATIVHMIAAVVPPTQRLVTIRSLSLMTLWGTAVILAVALLEHWTTAA